MTAIIRIKRRAAGGAAGPPASLAAAELAFNEQDNILYYGKGNSAGLATSILPVAGPGAFAALAGGSITGLTTLSIRDTSAPYDVTLAAASAPVLTAGRTLIFDMGDVAHTLDFGATANTITFPSVASYTLAGLGINNNGDLGVGVAPALGHFHVGGTYTSGNQGIVVINSTFASGNTGNVEGLRLLPTFNPTGATCFQFMGMETHPTLNNTALNLTNAYSYYGKFTLGAAYSGVITNGNIFGADIPTINAGSITNFTQFLGFAISAGGTATNTTFFSGGITAASISGTLDNRAIRLTVPSGSPAAGTTNNYGIHITGNGGTASGTGVVNNYAILSTSTAPIQIGGTFQFLGATASFPMLKRSATTIQVRLADDSAYGSLDAAAILDNGVAPLGTAGTGYIRGSALNSLAIVTATPATGGTVTLAAADRGLYVNTAALAALTIRLPPTPSAGQGMELCFANVITALTVQDSAGVLVTTAPTSAFGPGAAIIMRYVAAVGWVYWK